MKVFEVYLEGGLISTVDVNDSFGLEEISEILNENIWLKTTDGIVKVDKIIQLKEVGERF